MPHATAPPTPRRSGVERFEGLGKSRDSILLVGGALYVLGYLVWSVHALREGLGLLPALELQYLLAGTLLTLILATALLVGIATFVIGGLGPARLRRSRRRSLQRVAVVVPFLAGVLAGLGALALFISAGYIFILIAIPCGLLLVGISAVRVSPRLQRYQPFAIIGAFSVIVVIAASASFVVNLYPTVPQELGGVKPRCGYVEVARGDISPSLAKELFAEGAPRRPILRSRRLSILFSGGETYVVRLRKGKAIYDLRKEIVKSALAC